MLVKGQITGTSFILIQVCESFIYILFPQVLFLIGCSSATKIAIINETAKEFRIKVGERRELAALILFSHHTSPLR